VIERCARLLPMVALLVMGPAGCSHMHVASVWPFHHGAAAPAPAVEELIAEAPDGGSVVAVSQYWDRNTLLIDLSAAAGDGGVRLRPPAGTTWPVRLEFRVQPGSIARLQVEGAQRVTYNVPASGSAVLLKLDPGVYTARTAMLNVEWHAAAVAGG
jgi:hypothetical protein